MDICLSNVGSRCTGIFKLQMGRTLFPPHMRSEMRKSRTPCTAIFDPLLALLEVVKDSQKAMRYSSLFVSIRLKALALLP